MESVCVKVSVMGIRYMDVLSGANCNLLDDVWLPTTCLKENRVYAHEIASAMLTAISHLRSRRIEACKACDCASRSWLKGFSA